MSTFRVRTCRARVLVSRERCRRCRSWSAAVTAFSPAARPLLIPAHYCSSPPLPHAAMCGVPECDVSCYHVDCVTPYMARVGAGAGGRRTEGGWLLVLLLRRPALTACSAAWLPWPATTAAADAAWPLFHTPMQFHRGSMPHALLHFCLFRHTRRATGGSRRPPLLHSALSTHYCQCLSSSHTPLQVHHDSTRATERARRLIATRPAYYMASVHLACPIATGCAGAAAEAWVLQGG